MSGVYRIVCVICQVSSRQISLRLQSIPPRLPDPRIRRARRDVEVLVHSNNESISMLIKTHGSSFFGGFTYLGLSVLGSEGFRGLGTPPGVRFRRGRGGGVGIGARD
jgi:hypothetical protein